MDLSMTTLTFIFVDNANGHWNKAVVTAETEADVYEKYFMKYPERRGSEHLEVFPGDGEDITFGFERRN